MTSNMQFTYEVGHEILVAEDINILLSRVLMIYSKFIGIERGMISVDLLPSGGGEHVASYGFSDEEKKIITGDIDALCFPEISFIEGNITRVRVPVSLDSSGSAVFVFDTVAAGNADREQLGLVISVTVMIGYTLGLKVKSLSKFNSDVNEVTRPQPDHISLIDYINDIQKEIIIKYLKRHKGNITRTALNLGTTKRVLNYKIKNLMIDFRQYRKG